MQDRMLPVYERFSVEQKQIVVNMWNAGKTQKQIGEEFGVSRRTIMKLCEFLQLKRSPKEASTTKSTLDNEETIEKIKKLRNIYSLDEIAHIIGGSSSAIHRICKKYNIELDLEAYAVAQSERMKSAWTNDKRELMSGSRYVELNDKDWLREHYIDKKMSMGDISKLIGAPLMSVSYYISKYGIPKRSKDEIYSQLRRINSKRSVVKTKWGTFKLQSQAEENFVNSLSDSIKCVEYEKHKFEHIGLHYTPDFKVDDQFIEIKPFEYAKYPNVDRKAFVKQWLIAKANNVDIKCWYKNMYFDPEPIDDVDKYFCINWKLIFNSYMECYDFLISYGFHPLQWSNDDLLWALNSTNLHKIEGEDRLKANISNQRSTNFIKHFNPHLWYSTYKDYSSINKPFEFGNDIILKDSLKILWGRKRNINIYGLVSIISKYYRNFKVPSVFKPWVAEYVYEKLIPNGGIIVDPCMGWGGRFLGSIDGNYKYIGYDLNCKSVGSHNNMRTYIGSRIKNEPMFEHADAAKVVWPDGDLLFTSPPYDDMEYYYGLENPYEKTTPIYENIMKFNGIIALNVPKKHVEQCVNMANKYNKKLINEFTMITADHVGRRTLNYEPILIFT